MQVKVKAEDRIQERLHAILIMEHGVVEDH
jgi:hypothetical protein